MKSVTLLLSFLFVSAAFAQLKPFAMADTVFTVGQKYTTREILFALGSPSLRPESNVPLDSIVVFLNKNKNLKVEIQVHSDSRIDPKCCSKPTESRAKSIMEYLISKGIPAERLTAKGYGANDLLVSDAKISKAKTLEEKEALHSQNRRVVLKILSICNGG